MVKLLKKRRAKKQAEELAKKTALQKLRSKNRAKREADLKARREAAKVKKDMSPGMSGLASAEESAKKSAEMKKFREQQKKDQDTTKRAMANKKSRANVGFGEVYERMMADGTTKKMIKRKTGEDKAKHGGALAIMIAPVKTKKMKAVKKAPGGASMGKMKMMKKGGKLKPVPSDAKGLSKLPTSVRNKMGYMKIGGRMGSKEMMESMKKDDKMLKNGGKVTDPKKKRQSRKEAIKNIKSFGKGKGRGTGLIFSDSKSTKDAYKDAGKNVDMVKNTAKNPMPKKGLSLIEKARKKSGTKMMYGGSMKKAMYGAKMKKKAMYGAKMKK